MSHRFTRRSSSLVLGGTVALVVSSLLSVGVAHAAEPDAASPVPFATPSGAPGPLASSAPSELRPEGTWLVTGYDAWSEGLVAPLPGSTLTVSLLPEGRLEGETGCGTYLGGYSIDGDSIRLGVISKGPDPCGTRRTDEAFAFSQALALATTWAPAGPGMEFRDADGRVRVALVRASEAGLAGDWAIRRYAGSGGSLQETLPESSATIAFDTSGGITGSTGCRIFEGRYEVEIARIIIAIDVIGLPCDGADRRQDRRIRASLDAAVEWRREGDLVVLLDARAEPVAELAPLAASSTMDAGDPGVVADVGAPEGPSDPLASSAPSASPPPGESSA